MTERSDIVVVGGDASERRATVDQLQLAGLEARASGHVQLGLESSPSMVVVVGRNSEIIVQAARELPSLVETPVLVVVDSLDDPGVAESLAAGATDFILASMPKGLLASRCRNLLRIARSRGAMALAPSLTRVHDILSQHGDDAGALAAVLQVAVDMMGFDRASLIAHLEGSDNCFVIAATDAPSRSQFTLAIADYPEIAEAISTGLPVLIDDATTDPRTAEVAEKVAQLGIHGIAVFPVQWRGRPMGVMLLRRQAVGVWHLGTRGVDLGRLIASNMAAHLRHGDVIQSLRDQTHRISRARYEAERRMRGIHSLKEHFEAGADGVVVLDDTGRILFVNRAAERITGFARDGLVGGVLSDLVSNNQVSIVAEVVSKVLTGANLDPFDLQLSTTTGAPAWVSVSTSTVLADSGAVILTFRDVTAERFLETELRSTKEFLERLIDSTVDAIIAADLRGNIILFNQGAERLFGYTAADIIGRVRVWELYEQGVAKQIMKMLRSTAYGGVGRLEQTRREIRTSSGAVVPASLTASIIYEGEREVASVGILTDLRERIRMEQRLLQAQQKLQLTERQALIAELAGAAAHELNQPLTSIMGYAELIQRQSPPDASHQRAVGIIVSEAERMAGIVKKIGRITKYETTDYVGGARIMDLDRSTADFSSSLPLLDPELLESASGLGSDETREPVAARDTTRDTMRDAVDLRSIGDLDSLLELAPDKGGR